MVGCCQESGDLRIPFCLVAIRLAGYLSHVCKEPLRKGSSAQPDSSPCNRCVYDRARVMPQEEPSKRFVRPESGPE